MCKPAKGDQGDIDTFEESSCSESNQTAQHESSSRDNRNSQEDKETKDRIIRKEERAVRNARLLVAAAITVCAVTVSAAIYIFASRNDQSTFELEVSNTRNTLLKHLTEFPQATL
jgi:hypothetical protein